MMTYPDFVTACAAIPACGDGGTVPGLDLAVRRLTRTSEATRFADYPASEWEEEGRADVADAQIAENRIWTCDVVLPAGAARAGGAILLLHGLNERAWTKYHPWAAELARRTGRAVVLFPLAFHMQRAPASWAHARRMSVVLRRRMAAHPQLAHASVANAALSARIEQAPERFIHSGMQTVDDLVGLVRDIRTGAVACIAPDAPIDLFGYSIGAFIGQLLVLGDPGALFSDSRLVLFCGGPTFDRMHLASRYILDAAADAALRRLLLEQLDARADLAAGIDAHPVGAAFRSMLDASRHRTLREDGFRRVAGRMHAIALVQDDVVPPDAVRLTLQGEEGDLPHAVHVLDVPYPASHVAPFSENPRHAGEATLAFASVFERAAAHLMQA